MFVTSRPMIAHSFNTGNTPSTLLSDLVSYWKLDENSTGVAPVTRLDSVIASANNLTDTNNASSIAAVISNGVDFTANKNLTKSSNALLQVGDFDFTVAFWVKFDVLNTYLLFGKCISLALGSPTMIEYMVITLSNTIRIYVSNGVSVGTFAASATVTTGVYYYVVAWFDSVANTINIQLNNGSISSTAYTDVPYASTNALNVGGLTATFRLDGIMDEIGFWKRKLTVAEKSELYNSGLGLTYPF